MIYCDSHFYKNINEVKKDYPNYYKIFTRAKTKYSGWIVIESEKDMKNWEELSKPVIKKSRHNEFDHKAKNTS